MIGNFIVLYIKIDYLKVKIVIIFLILLIEFIVLRKYLKIYNYFDMYVQKGKENELIIKIKS